MKPPRSKASIPIADRAPRFMSLARLDGAMVEPLEHVERGSDGERELGAGAEAGVGGNGRADVELVGAAGGVGTGNVLQGLERPEAIRPFGLE